MKTIINCTPHEVTVLGSRVDPEYFGGTFPPSGTVARVETIAVWNGLLCECPKYHVKFGEIKDLPEQVEDTYYIVSQLVKQALPERDDLLSPYDLVRDDKGVVIGCRGFC